MDSLLGSPPSAIMSLLSSMAPAQGAPTGGMPPSGPMAPAQMPPMSAPPMGTVAPPPSMVDRIHSRLSGLLDSVKPDAPGGYHGLLSPEEMQAAQPGRATSLLGRVLGLGSDVFTKPLYGQNLDQTLKLKEFKDQLAEHHQQLGALHDMATLFPALPPTATQEQQIGQMRDMQSYLMSHNLYDQAKEVGAQMRGMMAVPKDPTLVEGMKEKAASAANIAKQRADYNTLKVSFPKHPLAQMPFDPSNPADYTAGLADARDLRKIAASADASASKEHWMPAGLDKESGQPLIMNTMTGETKVGGGVKPGGGGNATGAQAPVGDMVQRFDEIKKHAASLANGDWQMTRAMQTREGLEYGIANQSAGGHGVPLKEALAAGVMDHLGMGSGPDYERYQQLMNSTRAFGDDATKVFKGRQNEDAVKREIALSQLTPGDYKNPQVVSQKLNRMAHVIELAKLLNPNQMALTSNGHGSATGSKLDAYRHLLK